MRRDPDDTNEVFAMVVFAVLVTAFCLAVLPKSNFGLERPGIGIVKPQTARG